jgi:hypothetical protein
LFWWEAALAQFSISKIKQYIAELPWAWLDDIGAEQRAELPERLMLRAEALHGFASAHAFAT